MKKNNYISPQCEITEITTMSILSLSLKGTGADPGKGMQSKERYDDWDEEEEDFIIIQQLQSNNQDKCEETIW